MDWGMQNRLAKIIHPKDGRCLMLAVDHGYFLGPTERLEVPRRAINPLLPYADSLMLTRGILRTSVDPKYDIPIVLRVSGAISIIGEDLSKETITTSMEEAIRLNASCLALSIFVGSKYEHQTLANLARLVDEGEKYGLPVLAVTAVGKEMARDARYLGLACRIAAELGAENLILMTDIAGLLRNKEDPNTLIPFVNVSEVPFMKRQGIISGGMIPKIDCCVEAVRRGVKKTSIIDGRVPHSILIEILSSEGIGTQFK